MTSRPLVSVVIATYNRSYVLRHAVRSVLDSTLEDFELIVVGDHCTDDTEEVVAGFRDPRLRYTNLPQNCGDQSEPNNRGLDLAQGRFIALLNHDDLFFPDHLERSVEELQKTGAEFLWSPILTVAPVLKGDDRTGNSRSVSLGSTPPNGIYDPLTSCLASSWTFRKELFKRVGRWQSSDKLFVFPSQDWMFRVWRSGARMVFHSHLGVLVILSGRRKGSYRQRQSPEHEMYAREIRENPRFREELLESAAIAQAETLAKLGDGRISRFAMRRLSVLMRPLLGLLARRGIHPKSLYAWLRYGRGGANRRHRRIVGLD